MRSVALVIPLNLYKDSIAVAGVLARQFAQITRIQSELGVKNIAHPIMPERFVPYQFGI